MPCSMRTATASCRPTSRGARGTRTRSMAARPAALLAHLVERFEPSATQVARLTIELLRPVPLVPLRVETHMIRPGKKVQLVGASLFADDTEVVRASAWRIRTGRHPVPARARRAPRARARRHSGDVRDGVRLVRPGDGHHPGPGCVRCPRPGGGLVPAAPTGDRGRGARAPSCGSQRRPTSGTASAASSPGTSTCSSTPTSPSPSTGIQWGSGSASTRSPGPATPASASPRPPSTTPTAASAAPSRPSCLPRRLATGG